MKSNNFAQTMRIAGIELKTMFYSPVAWLVLIVFAVQAGYAYTEAFGRILDSADLGRSAWSVSQEVFGKTMTGILSGIQKYIYLYIPLITMGLMSREYQSGSIKLLYSSPVRNSSIILGKFLSMTVYGAALMSVLLVTVLFTACAVPHFDLSMVLVALLGLYMLILAYSAIGIFFSSLTKYQVAAAVGTLATLAFLGNVDQIGQGNTFTRNITYWLGMSGRAGVFLDGLFTTEDFLYFVIVIVLFLWLSIFRLDTAKSVMSLKSKIVKYVGIVAVCVGIGCLTTLPQFKLYYDATYTQKNTLSCESREILAGIHDRLTVTTYVNLLDDDIVWALPRNRNYDMKRLEKYLRFKPDTKLKYVYYYCAENNNASLKETYPGMTPEEMGREVCKIYGMDPNMFMSKEEIDKIIDLAPEKYEWVRAVEDQHGHREFMRMFNDNQKLPEEAEMSVVFSKMINKGPLVGFVDGYGARDISNYGSRGYWLLGHDKWFRQSLFNMGFDVCKVNLDSPGSLDSLDVLVLSDIGEPLSETALANVGSYIDRGGDMFLLGGYRRSEYLKPVADKLGIKFCDGILVQENEYVDPTYVAADFTEKAVESSQIYSDIARWGYCVLMPTAVALDCSGVSGFDVMPVLETTDKAWIEYETTDFVDGEFVCNTSAGEKQGVYTPFVNLSRKVGDKEQRIAVSGDADFIANEELTSTHSGISSSNYSIAQGVFRWFSDDKLPVVVERIDPIDGETRLPMGFSLWLKIIFLGIIPVGLLLTGLMLIIRRQRK